MAWEIGTYKKEYENLKYQIEEYQDFWEWFENKYGQTKAELFDEFYLERAKADSTSEGQSNIPDVIKSVCGQYIFQCQFNLKGECKCSEFCGYKQTILLR